MDRWPAFTSIVAACMRLARNRSSSGAMVMSCLALARRFQAADRILLGVPMWNFAYPYKLKHLIDLAGQRDFLFTFDGKAHGTLGAGRQAVCHLRPRPERGGRLRHPALTRVRTPDRVP